MSELELESFDPQRRRLCPDGACVGVIGADGRCRVCGTPDPGGPPAAGLGPEAFAGGCTTDDEVSAEVVVAPLPSDHVDPAESGFDPRRALCPDGACVGVLGPDGRCPVCGQLAER